MSDVSATDVTTGAAPASPASASGATTGIATAVAGLGLTVDPAVIDVAGLAAVSGPFLTANIVDGRGAVVAVVAVIDGPDGGDETLLERLASVAALEVGGTVSSGEPVAGGADLGARFEVPVQVEVYGDGTRITVVSVSTADRRGGPSAPAGAAGPVSGVLGVPVSGGGLEKLINVSLDVSVELGRTRVTLAEVLDYDVGSVVELDRAAGAPVDVRVNDTLLAQGEVVLIDDEYAVRITAIFDPNNPHH